MDFPAGRRPNGRLLREPLHAVIDDRGDPVDKSFGMSWWRSLADLDRWAKDHPTHKAIFGQAMKYPLHHGSSRPLRLYHEVTVAQRTISTSSTSAATPAPPAAGPPATVAG
jgi:hypothetical protein